MRNPSMNILFPSLVMVSLFFYQCAATTHKLMEHSNSQKLPHVKKLGRAAQNHMHEVVFAVKQRNLEELEKILYEVSDPDGPKYGQHLSREEVRKMTANPSASHKVKQYLQSIGADIIEESLGSEYLVAVAPLKVWEREFQTEFHHYGMRSLFEPDKEEELFLRAEHYSIPNHIAEEIETVFNTVQFPPPTRSPVKFSRPSPEFLEKHSRGGGADPFVYTQPPINDSYNPYHPFASPLLVNYVYDVRNNEGHNMTSQGIYESNQVLDPLDLSNFQSFFGVPEEPIALDVGGYMRPNFCGGNDDSNGTSYYSTVLPSIQACAEANLDAQYIMSMAQHVPTYYYAWNKADFIVSWIINLAKSHDIADVISVSYGGAELFWPSSYVTAFNREAMKLSVTGVTLIIASGDYGAPNVIPLYNHSWCGYFADFPSNSPYVTSIGSTMGPETSHEEVACQATLGGIITSAGGFSAYLPTPTFQRNAVKGYFDYVSAHPEVNPVPGFNRRGRGFPDISVLGANFLLYVSGELQVASGTSFSAPIFAGMVSLINAQRRSVGAPVLGWLNPALYSRANLFVHDITSGKNNCTVTGFVHNHTEVICCAHGFTAVPGWDPVTGLGSLNFTEFFEVFKAPVGYSSSSNAQPQTQSQSQAVREVAGDSVHSTSSGSTSSTISSTSGSSSSDSSDSSESHWTVLSTLMTLAVLGALLLATTVMVLVRYQSHKLQQESARMTKKHELELGNVLSTHSV